MKTKKWLANGRESHSPATKSGVDPMGLEPMTHSLEGCRSVRLSYGSPPSDAAKLRLSAIPAKLFPIFFPT